MPFAWKIANGKEYQTPRFMASELGLRCLHVLSKRFQVLKRVRSSPLLVYGLKIISLIYSIGFRNKYFNKISLDSMLYLHINCTTIEIMHVFLLINLQ